MPWVGVPPALSVFYVRKFVNEPPLWVENRRKQRSENREARVPLISIFARGMLVNTLLACWWMASNFVLYYCPGRHDRRHSSCNTAVCWEPGGGQDLALRMCRSFELKFSLRPQKM